MTNCINNTRSEEALGQRRNVGSAPLEGSAIAGHVGRFCQLQRAGSQPGILLPRRSPFTESARFVSYASPRLLSLWAA
ncbi:hypothetical protein [Bradyrhizobium sp. BRP56]|uniref:hypothetical protein n=1 Tax=Bradyrhizobium sp. BRP56 TaxID=2793819 RepID=UPI001CD2DAB3|nr:hypothetical protein [Bradyrhizobium sp. BRP56]MCA1395696.1 hypothetical protein [Bradyrhizobium sp. BRP56]